MLNLNVEVKWPFKLNPGNIANVPQAINNFYKWMINNQCDLLYLVYWLLCYPIEYWQYSVYQIVIENDVNYLRCTVYNLFLNRHILRKIMLIKLITRLLNAFLTMEDIQRTCTTMYNISIVKSWWWHLGFWFEFTYYLADLLLIFQMIIFFYYLSR